ncbi:hypothetical protein [Rhodocaloribacter sp.]
MDYVLRSIKRAKWEPAEHTAGIRADALGCIRTQGDILSVWRCSSEESDIREAALAYASAMERPSTFDIVILNLKKLVSKGLEYTETPGKTPIADLKDLHLDIVRLDVEKITYLAECIAEVVRNENDHCIRFRRKEVIEMIVHAISCGKVQLEKLASDMRKVIEKELNKS